MPARTFNCAEANERAAGLREAASAVRRGDLVVLPTDTVYGIGTDAFSHRGIESLLNAKGRGRHMPVPVLVPSVQTLHGLIASMPQIGWELVEAFWPGGLSLVAMHQKSLQWDLGENRGTVSVRMPLHPVALELLEKTGPMGVSSANVSGRPAAKTAGEAEMMFGDRVAVYLESGVQAELPSTIVDLTSPTPRLLRAGAVTVEQLREVVPDLEVPGEAKPWEDQADTKPADDETSPAARGGGAAEPAEEEKAADSGPPERGATA